MQDGDLCLRCLRCLRSGPIDTRYKLLQTLKVDVDHATNVHQGTAVQHVSNMSYCYITTSGREACVPETGICKSSMHCSFGSKAVVRQCSGHVMPVPPWRKPGDPEYGTDAPARYDIIELAAYDDQCRRQGSLLVGVLQHHPDYLEGKSFEGTYLAASDDYYHHWATEVAGGSETCHAPSLPGGPGFWS